MMKIWIKFKKKKLKNNKKLIMNNNRLELKESN